MICIALTFKQISEALGHNSALNKAVYLSQQDFAVADSISYTDPSLANGYNNLNLNYDNSGYNLRRQVSYYLGTDVSVQSIKRITVSVYQPDGTLILSTGTYRTKNVTYGPYI